MHPVESKYCGVCNIYEKQDATDSTTNITSQTWVKVVESQPCRMVVESSPATVNQNGAPAVSEIITLLISPTVEILPGSGIEILQEGREEYFKRAGIPIVYPSHQEVTLVRVERWA